jgi:hypothetical protein
MLIPGHFVVLASNGEVRAAFQRQAANDWKLFLSLRASELKPGGRLVVVLPGLNDGGSAGLEPLFGHASDALADVVADGSISAEDRARMVLGAYPRRRSELLAPFAIDAQFRGLTVEHCELSVLPDAAWEDYERDANKEALATRHARFFRSVFAPSLAAMIAVEGKRNVFPDRLEEKLKRRLADHPVPFHTYVQTMVLAKHGATSTRAAQN